MNLFWLVTSVGLILFYFVVHAFKVEFFTLEMLTHNMYHFLSGMISLGILVHWNPKKKFKIYALLIIGILIFDEINDFTRGVSINSFLIVFYNLYLILWGALTGFTIVRHLKEKKK